MVSWYRDISSIIMKEKDRNRLQSNKVQAHFLEKRKAREREKTSPEAMTLIDHAQSWKEIYFRVGRRKISYLYICLDVSFEYTF